jgi:uncharacterized membrane protein
MLLRSIVVCAAALTLSSAQHEPARQPTATVPRAGFLDKVWMVTESPAGKTMDRYVFLYDGTYVQASKDGAPRIGKWSWDGVKLTLIDDSVPSDVEILSLTDSTFQIRIDHMKMGRYFDLTLVPATASMPDTTRPIAFDPANHEITASGDDPTWLFWVENDRATLRTAREGTVRYTGHWYAECAAVWTWEGTRTDHPDQTLDLSISTSKCEKSPNAGEYPLSAHLTRGETAWRGCALAGKLRAPKKP